MFISYGPRLQLPTSISSLTPISQQKRRLHTLLRRSNPSTALGKLGVESRKLHMDRAQSFKLLKKYRLDTDSKPTRKEDHHYLVAVTVDRSNRGVCIVVGKKFEDEDARPYAKRYALEQGRYYIPIQLKNQIFRDLRLDAAGVAFSNILDGLVNIFYENEAIILETRVTRARTHRRKVTITDARFIFDDSAYRIARRQTDIHERRKVENEDANEVEAEQYGIVYVK